MQVVRWVLKYSIGISNTPYLIISEALGALALSIGIKCRGMFDGVISKSVSNFVINGLTSTAQTLFFLD